MRPIRSGGGVAKRDGKRGKRKDAKRRKAAKKRKPKLNAKNADRHELYQRSVQEPSADIELIHRAFRKETGRRPLSLREDFCGTALISSAWVKSRKDRVAIGVDLDGPTLDWGREHNLAPLGKAAERVTLLEKNVLEVREPLVDVVCAFNFSYCVFHERQELLAYFRGVRESLSPEGVFFLDNHAGTSALEDAWDEREVKRFTYIWEQKPVDGISHRGIRKIHFRFRDGSMLKNAFKYDWRMWTVAELRDVAAEAGFRRVDVYAEDLDEDGDPITGLRKRKRYRNEESWIPYLACWR